MKKFLLIVSGFVLLMIVWWNQPHFGYRFCVTDGFKSSKDFVKDAQSKALERLDAGLSYRASQGIPEIRLKKLKEERTAQINKAFDLINLCIAERAIDYCRYIGPFSDTGLSGQSTKAVPENESHNYKFIVPDSKIEISVSPYRDKSQTRIGASFNSETPEKYFTKKDFKKWRKNSEIIMSFDVCNFGCLCTGD